ncbi:hypothetical protein ACHAWU_001210 [Discostella pseudostelligera]|uniref:Uncharacterized protein n=1 Tax=Discostella pseudostelligera TaxID=259834 RepID=A0ABD3M6C0_9STRA
MFRVTLEGPTVAGFLPSSVVSLIAEQWEYVSSILPDNKNNWYERAMRNFEKQKTKCKTAFYEEDGIRALLSYSMLCLLAAEESGGDERDEFLRTSFSVLLPMVRSDVRYYAQEWRIIKNR